MDCEAFVVVNSVPLASGFYYTNIQANIQALGTNIYHYLTRCRHLITNICNDMWTFGSTILIILHNTHVTKQCNIHKLISKNTLHFNNSER